MGLFKSIRTLSRKAVACIAGTAMAASGAVAMSAGVPEAKAAETVPQNLSFAIGLRNVNQAAAGGNSNSSIFFTVKEGSTQYPYHQRAAYCVDANLHAPGWNPDMTSNSSWVNIPGDALRPDGMTQAQYYHNPQYAPYVLKESVQGSLGWVAGIGFPHNITNTNPPGNLMGYPTSWADSQTATQFALWMLKGQIQWNADKSAVLFTPAYGGGVFANSAYLTMAHNDQAAHAANKVGWKMSDVIDKLVADARAHANQTEYTAHIYQPADASKRGEWQNFLYVTREQPKRQVTIKKTSAKPEYTANNNAYSMEGAQYTLTNSNGQVVHTFTTKADGTASDTVEVPAGRYTIKE
ncbi:MAG: prealbumin-like fold domain-containing protein, partial [Bacteroidaceae bacterium]|nr:prealbumin-like fold domain-containing protein [Bacteroidaceae bacterium]